MLASMPGEASEKPWCTGFEQVVISQHATDVVQSATQAVADIIPFKAMADKRRPASPPGSWDMADSMRLMMSV